MEILKFRKGDIIFEEGDLEDWMYEIRKGMVGIYAAYGAPAEKELTALEEGSFLGELGLITGSERSAAAVALENTELLKITDEELAEYFVANPGKIIRVMKQRSQSNNQPVTIRFGIGNLHGCAINPHGVVKIMSVTVSLKQWPDILHRFFYNHFLHTFSRSSS